MNLSIQALKWWRQRCQRTRTPNLSKLAVSVHPNRRCSSVRIPEHFLGLKYSEPCSPTTTSFLPRVLTSRPSYSKPFSTHTVGLFVSGTLLITLILRFTHRNLSAIVHFSMALLAFCTPKKLILLNALIFV